MIRVKLTFADGTPVDTAEYDVVAVEVQTIDPPTIEAAEHGFGIVIKEQP